MTLKENGEPSEKRIDHSARKSSLMVRGGEFQT